MFILAISFISSALPVVRSLLLCSFICVIPFAWNISLSSNFSWKSLQIFPLYCFSLSFYSFLLYSLTSHFKWCIFFSLPLASLLFSQLCYLQSRAGDASMEWQDFGKNINNLKMCRWHYPCPLVDERKWKESEKKV